MYDDEFITFAAQATLQKELPSQKICIPPPSEIEEGKYKITNI